MILDQVPSNLLINADKQVMRRGLSLIIWAIDLPVRESPEQYI